MNELPMTFWTAPEIANTVVTTKQLRAIQLYHGGQIMARGYLWNIKRQALGGGIYKLTLELKN